MTLRRTAYLAAKNGVVASYMHNAIAPGLGKIGVIVALEFDGRCRASSRPSAGRSPCISLPPIRRAVDVDSLDKALDRARARGAHRAGEGVRQARSRHREDGRRPPAEILRGGRAAGAGLRARSRHDRGEGLGRRREGGRRADQDHRFLPLRLRRGDRPARKRFRGGGWPPLHRKPRVERAGEPSCARIATARRRSS